MNKRKETAAKILTLLDGLNYYEANCILEQVNKRLECASFVSVRTYWDREKSVVPTEFMTVFDAEKAFANRQ